MNPLLALFVVVAIAQGSRGAAVDDGDSEKGRASDGDTGVDTLPDGAIKVMPMGDRGFE